MKAIGYQQSLPADHPQSLQDINIEKPTPGPRDVLVQVKAIAVNPVDTKIRMRITPDDNSYKVIGWDASGEVVAVGSDVQNYKPGDEVWYAGALNRPGCNAQFQIVDERIVGCKPKSLSHAEAAALPLTTITAWELLFERLQVPTDKPAVLLVTGAAGGVGSILVQLAKQLTRATVVATASRAETKAWVTQLGADVVLDHSQPLSDELAKHKLADVTHVASLTHTAEHFAELVKMLRPQGRLALIDDPTEPLDFSSMKQKSLSLQWEFMFTRSLFETDDMDNQRQLLNEVAALVDAGKIKTTLGEHLGTINAANLRRAHQQLEQHTAIGKLVLEGFDN